MSISDRQLGANRRNALKSTGPLSPEAKSRVSSNALKHGAYAADVVLRTENDREYRDLFLALVEEYQPASPTEHQLVQDLADYRWRLSRAVRAETGRYNELIDKHRGILTRYHRSVPPKLEDIEPRDFELRVLGDAAHQTSLVRLGNHESRLRRHYLRTMQYLVALKQHRENMAQVVDGKEDSEKIGPASEG